MINKRKVYVRRWKCSVCREPIIATYNKEEKVWFLKCMCGVDKSFKRIENDGIFSLLSKKVYPID
jgi:hypothetical protein